MRQVDRGCVKTSARLHTSLFRSLLRGLRAFRVEKVAKNLARSVTKCRRVFTRPRPEGDLQGLPYEREEARESGLWLHYVYCAIAVVNGEPVTAGGRSKPVLQCLSALIGMLSTARWSAMKNASNPSALERLSEVLQVLEVEVRVRIGPGIAPPSGMDSHRAHEGAEAQLPFGH
jgi:hypothetical protein